MTNNYHLSKKLFYLDNFLKIFSIDDELAFDIMPQWKLLVFDDF